MKIDCLLPKGSLDMFLTHRSVSKVNDEWFADEEKVRKTVGLLENDTPLPDDQEVTIKCGSLLCFPLEPQIVENDYIFI